MAQLRNSVPPVKLPVTEEMTYNGYALPRLQVLTGGRTWLAVMMVALAWAVQHAFLRFRWLPPLIFMHWGMDLFSAIAMITVV